MKSIKEPAIRQPVKMPYPPLAGHGPYIVVRGKGDGDQTLNSRYSHHVARLVINTMPGPHIL